MLDIYLILTILWEGYYFIIIILWIKKLHLRTCHNCQNPYPSPSLSPAGLPPSLFHGITSHTQQTPNWSTRAIQPTDGLLFWTIMNLSFWRIIKYTQQLPKTDVESIIAKALQLWSQASPLKFISTSEEEADIKIAFVQRGRLNAVLLNFVFSG